MKKPPMGGFCFSRTDGAVRRHEASLSDQTEKLDPQPQVVVAFGFLMTNCAPC